MSEKPKPTGTPGAGPTPTGGEHEVRALQRRHLKFGWWSLLLFLTLGLGLEALHGFKVGLYLNVSNETRRLMWRLAHVHGTLLALVNVVFGVTLPLARGWATRTRDFAGSCLMAASVLIPGGFFLGGVVIYAGDPGLGIVLVPVGGLLLFVAIYLTARAPWNG